jgi:hypothetical protein
MGVTVSKKRTELTDDESPSTILKMLSAFAEDHGLARG